MANSIARLAVHFAADVTGLKAGIAQVNSMLASVGSSQTQQASTGGGSGGGLLGMLGISTRAGVIAGSAAALLGLAAAGTAAAAEMQTLNLQFEVLTGSSAAASTMLGELKQLAADTPLGLQEVSQAAKTLLAMGEERSTVVSELEMLGNVASITGQPLNELAQVFGQVMQAGRLTGNELRQFNERGIPLLTTLADMMGVSTTSIRAMVEAGEIGSDKVVAAFRRMTGEGGLFANAMQRNLDALSGQWGKLTDRMKIMGANIMRGPTEALTKLISVVNQALDLIDGGAKGGGAEKRKADLDALEQNKAAKARQAQMEADANKQREEAEKAAKEMRKRADSIAQSLREPSEVFADTLAELKGLQEQGLLDWDTYVKGVTKAMGDLRAAEERSSPKLKAPQPSQGVGAVVQGTTAAFSAIQQAARDSQAQLDYQRQLIEIEKKEQATLDKILAAANAQKPVRVKQVNL